MILQANEAYLELSTEEFAEVLRLDPQDGLVDFPLLLTACDGEVGEESVRQEAIVVSIGSMIFPRLMHILLDLGDSVV